MERWSISGVLLPDGAAAEEWWVDDGVLRHGPAPTDGPAAEPLPGRYVVAGLVDAHTHLAMTFERGEGIVVDDTTPALQAQLAAGVLAVRDVGVPVGREVERGRGREGLPDVLGGSHYITAPGTYFPALSEGIDADRAADAAAAQARAGVDWVKVVADSPVTAGSFFDPPPVFTPEVLGGIVDAVHAAGGRVAAHTTGRSVRDAVLAGVDSVEHGSLVDEELLTHMVRHGVAWTPTVGTVLGGVAAMEAMGADDLVRLARPHVEQLSESIPRAEAMGVTVLAGTDMLGHGNLADEVAALCHLGLSPAAAVAAATTAPRAFLGLPGLTDGEPAELVTYHDDPREDPDVLRRPVAVVHAGHRIA